MKHHQQQRFYRHLYTPPQRPSGPPRRHPKHLLRRAHNPGSHLETVRLVTKPITGLQDDSVPASGPLLYATIPTIA